MNKKKHAKERNLQTRSQYACTAKSPMFIIPLPLHAFDREADILVYSKDIKCATIYSNGALICLFIMMYV